MLYTRYLLFIPPQLNGRFALFLHLREREEDFNVRDKTDTEKISWLIWIGLLMILVEFSFNRGGPMFFLILSLGCIYIGRKRLNNLRGKAIFWFGIIGFVFALFSTWAFKFFLMVLVVYFIAKFRQNKHDPKTISPSLKEPVGQSEEEFIVKRPLFQNKWIGHQETKDYAYEWDDINIQCGAGDTIVDLTNTVLPKGESVIFVRNFIGNVQIVVPYDLELSLSHSSLVGTSNILSHKSENMINQTIIYRSGNYSEAIRKIKIVTSLFIGDLEVRRG
jgi:lia operon protein LiaF